MNPRTALTLRLVGPLIEIACVLLLRRFGGRGLTLAWVSVETLLYAGLAVGLALVVAGLALARRPREIRPEDDP